MRKFLVTLIIPVMLCGLCPALFASEQLPISVKSDTLEYDNGTGSIKHLGNVIVSQAGNRLTSDQLIIIKDKNGQFSSLKATGSPAHFYGTFIHGDSTIEASADTIVYSPLTNLLTLEKNAMVKKEGEQFTGPKITFDLSSEIITAHRDTTGRPTLVMQPK